MLIKMKKGPNQTFRDQKVGELGMVAHTSNPSTQEVEPGKSRIQAQPGLHSDFQTSVNYNSKILSQRKKKYPG
jgi:hypothetical protein